MDQSLINWVFAGFGATLGWLMKVVWDAIKDLKADMKQIERDLPEIYVRKDDFKSAVHDMKEDMKELRLDMKDGFAKIDNSIVMLYKKLDHREDRQ